MLIYQWNIPLVYSIIGNFGEIRYDYIRNTEKDIGSGQKRDFR